MGPDSMTDTGKVILATDGKAIVGASGKRQIGQGGCCKHTSPTCFQCGVCCYSGDSVLNVAYNLLLVDGPITTPLVGNINLIPLMWGGGTPTYLTWTGGGSPGGIDVDINATKICSTGNWTTELDFSLPPPNYLNNLLVVQTSMDGVAGNCAGVSITNPPWIATLTPPGWTMDVTGTVAISTVANNCCRNTSGGCQGGSPASDGSCNPLP